MRWGLLVGMSTAAMLLCQTQLQAQADKPYAVTAVPGSPSVGQADPLAKKVAYRRCAPGAHWQTSKVWRNGKKIRVGHCVLNKV